MTAVLSGGATYSGPFFHVTRETTIDELGTMWTGWGHRWRWRGWSYWGQAGAPSPTILVACSAT